MTIDIEVLSAILRDAAKAEIVPRFRRLDEGMVRAKANAFDLVTEADEAAERVITAAIGTRFPGVRVIGEEAVAADPSLIATPPGEGTVIYVDPVDGTYNFAAGLPLFAVMAAVVVDGETVAGIIYDPIGDDFVLAERGSGCWQVFPDGLRVRQAFAPAVPLAEMGGTASASFLAPEDKARVLGNLSKVRMFASYRCAGHEYRMGAGGSLHFLMFNKLMPWDHLAGALMMEEAGAHVARFDGSHYRAEHLDGGLLIASNIESWQTLRREILTV